MNAYFRWKCLIDTQEKLGMSIFLVSPVNLKTAIKIPVEATADVSLRRIQSGQIKSGGSFQWTCGSAKGAGKADADGINTHPGVTIASAPTTLTITKLPN